MGTLSEEEIGARLDGLPGWSLTLDRIRKTYEFPDFRRAVAFVNSVAEIAEAHQHHPDIDIRYNKVTLIATSHDAGRLTERDFALAEAIERVPR